MPLNTPLTTEQLEQGLRDFLAAPRRPAYFELGYLSRIAPTDIDFAAYWSSPRCAHCDAPMIEGINDPVEVITSMERSALRDTSNAALYGQQCCIEPERIHTVQCSETGHTCRASACIWLQDDERWVHYSQRVNFYQDHEGNFWSDEENAPPTRDPDREDNGLYYYGADVMGLCEAPSPGRKLAFGVELEMETTGDSVEVVLDNVGGPRNPGKGYILKHDGSLNDGIELVTVPKTLREHSDGDYWAKMLKPFRKSGCISGSTTTCGMHVHVNRAALSALTIGKLLVFINSQNPATHALVTNVSQRSPNGYCGRYPKKVRDGIETSSDKYSAVHLLPRTVEFRIFRGNMRPERVLKNLEFVHALCTYMPTCSVAQCENPQAFLAWVASRRKDYPNLFAFLAERNQRPAILTEPNDTQLRETAESEAA